MNKKNKQKKQSIIEASFFETQEAIIEQIYDSYLEEKLFCVYKKFDQTIDFVREINLESGRKLIPIQYQVLIENNVVLLPSSAANFISENELIQEIKRFIHSYLDIEPMYEVIVAYYVLMTWLYDQLSVVPYLRGLGEYGSGKTRLAQVVGSICYKTMFLAGATSDAYIFRIIELFHGTLVLNELERVNTDLQSQLTIILNNGYEKGMPVGRVEGKEKREPRTFDVFSPKIFTTRKKFSDPALESRIISVPMRQTSRMDITPFLDKSFWDGALLLRNKLLMYRFKHFGNFIYQEKELKAKQERLGFLEPRIKQTLLPLYYVITDDTLDSQFVEFAKQYQNLHISERQFEINGVVFEKIYCLISNGNTKITVKEVTEEVNKDIEKEIAKYTSKKIGKIIREDLGLNTYKSTGGIYAVEINQTQLDYLISRYGVESPLTPQSPLSESDSKMDIVGIVDVMETETQEKLQNDNENTENQARSDKPIFPCSICQSAKFWKTKFDSILCVICHPPLSEDEVMEWIEI